jgi:putative transposase
MNVYLAMLFENYGEAYKAVAEYMEYYNERRIHSSIRDLSPEQFYKQNQVCPIPIKAVRL